MQDLCELASSGSNQYFLFALTICVIMFGAIAFLHNRKLLKTGHVFTILVAVFIGFSSYHFVSAADANCNNNSTDQNSGANDNNGLLVDDSQSLTGDSGIYTSKINVLSNDNAPEGDPFDIDTLAFSGLPSATSSLGFTTYFSLDPNDSTLPDPDSPWTMSVPANVWGWWEPELACDNVDGIYCGSTPTPGETVCLDNSTNACYLTGYVTASFVSNAPADQYSLQYTVTTQGGISLDPATVTVTLPVIISSDPFYDSYAGGGNCGIYDPWDSGWSFDIMSHVSTNGPSPLLASTIDLDPSTPGQQTSVSYGSGVSLTIFTVDSNGIVTVNTPNDTHPYFGFSYTIKDAIGNISPTFTGLELVPNNSCS